MRKYSELNLVNLANNLIGKLGISFHKPRPGHEASSDCNAYLTEVSHGMIKNSRDYYFTMPDDILENLRKQIAKMNLTTLASIIVFAESSPTTGSPFRNTTIRPLLKGSHNISGCIDFIDIPIEIDGLSGLRIMRYLAELVIVGTMYDILMTERVLQVKPEPFGHSEGEPHPYGYEAKQAMIDFVQKHRPNSHCKNVKTDIQDQTLAMYLEQCFGVKAEYPKKVGAAQRLTEQLSPGDTTRFSFQIPDSIQAMDVIISEVRKYLKKTNPRMKPGESGDSEGDFFWIFEDKRPMKGGGTELKSCVRCWINPRRRIFSAD